MGPPQSTVVWAPRSPGCLPPTPQQDQHHALAAPPAPPTPPSSLQGWPPTPPPGDVPWEGARAPGNCWEGLWDEQGRGSRGSPTHPAGQPPLRLGLTGAWEGDGCLGEAELRNLQEQPDRTSVV